MDILWIIVFIIYISIRTMGERKKGMERKTPPRKTPPKPQPRTPPRTQPKPQPVLTRHVAEPYKPFEGADYGEIGTGAFEGQSEYDNLPYMEGIAPEKPAKAPEHRPELQEGAAVYTPELVTAGFALDLTADSLRQAVIWSEILQQPRFRRRRCG